MATSNFAVESWVISQKKVSVPSSLYSGRSCQGDTSFPLSCTITAHIAFLQIAHIYERSLNGHVKTGCCCTSDCGLQQLTCCKYAQQHAWLIPMELCVACGGVAPGCWGDLQEGAVGKGVRLSLWSCGVDRVVQADVCEGVFALAGADQQGACIVRQPLLRPC